MSRFSTIILTMLGMTPFNFVTRVQAQITPDQVCSRRGLFVDSCFTVHGRLRAYNGNPPYRIWILGTNRILGVDDNRGCVTPPALDSLIGVQDMVVYADIVVRPLTRNQPGVMRMVCIASARHVVARPAYFIHRPPR